jgi:hypothetical protein
MAKIREINKPVVEDDWPFRYDMPDNRTISYNKVLELHTVDVMIRTPQKKLLRTIFKSVFSTVKRANLCILKPAN